MFGITQEQLKKLRIQFPKGAKVRLVKWMTFKHRRLARKAK